MAYSRGYSRRRRYSRRRPTSKKSIKTRRSPRYRRRVKRVTNRRIANVSSEKKSDSRVFFSNIAAPANPPIFAAPILLGGNTYSLIHMPTAMDKSSTVAQDIGNYRDRSDVYMRGYQETLRMTTNSGAAWNWRRVVFCVKGPSIYSTVTASNALYLEAATNGWVRTWVNHTGTTVGQAAVSLLFKGSVNIDWVDPFTASIDSTKVDLVYDKYSVLRSGNDDNSIHNRKMWHPFNKKFIYDDEENGATESERLFHIPSKPGMGDVYVVDFFQCSDNAPANTLQIDGTGRLYWHEK